MAATEGELQPLIFESPVGSYELSLINDNCIDYLSVWILDGYPVAAAAPVDNFFRTITPVSIK
ncbi:hypothetical protein CXT15_21090 [Salmonella enterica]|nr:hypothetical protein [Salmonella enterica]